MTLTAHGNIYITAQEVREKKWTHGSFFEFEAVSKHPTKDKKIPHKISVFVPDEKLERAREVFKSGQMLGLRHAELDTYKYEETGAIYATIRASWKDLEILKVAPTKEKQ